MLISYHCYNISFSFNLHFLFKSHLSILSSIYISFHHFLQPSHFFSPSDSFPFSSLFEIRRICIHGTILLYNLFYRDLLFFSLLLLLLLQINSRSPFTEWFNSKRRIPSWDHKTIMENSILLLFLQFSILKRILE